MRFSYLNYFFCCDTEIESYWRIHFRYSWANKILTELSTLAIKGTKAWTIFKFFLPKSYPYMPLVKFWTKLRCFSFDFRQNFEVRTFSRWLSIRGTKKFFGEISKKIFSQKVHLGPIRRLAKRGFSKFRFLRVEICILIWDFRVIFENYSMCMLGIRGNDLSHTEHTRKRFHRTLSIRGTNFCACSASGKMWTVFTCKFMLSKRGTNFIAHWAYTERISSLPEHTWNGFHCWLSIRGNV